MFNEKSDKGKESKGIEKRKYGTLGE